MSLLSGSYGVMEKIWLYMSQWFQPGIGCILITTLYFEISHRAGAVGWAYRDKASGHHAKQPTLLEFKLVRASKVHT